MTEFLNSLIEDRAIGQLTDMHDGRKPMLVVDLMVDQPNFLRFTKSWDLNLGWPLGRPAPTLRSNRELGVCAVDWVIDLTLGVIDRPVDQQSDLSSVLHPTCTV